jgi:hypothetical protein
MLPPLAVRRAFVDNNPNARLAGRNRADLRSAKMEGSLFVVFLMAILAVAVLTIAGMWKVYTKAGEPGWASIIPIYNLWVLMRIAGKPGWWLILFCIPIVSIVASIAVWIGVAERFGKGSGFGIGCAILSFIFVPILGFGDAEFQGGNEQQILSIT